MNRLTTLSVALLFTAVVAVILIQSGRTKNNTPAPTKKVEKTKIKLLRSFAPVRGLSVLTAEKKGFFDKRNLDVDAEPFIKGIDIVLVSGQFDVSSEGLATYLAAAIKGADITLVGTTIQIDPFYLVGTVTKNNIKRVAINRLGGEDYYQTVNTLRLMGIDPKNVTFVLSGQYEAKYPMLLTSKVDVGGFTPLQSFFAVKDQFKKDGISVIYNRTDNESAYYPTGVTVRNDFLKKHPQAVKDLMLALKEGIDYARSHENESIELIEKEFEVSKEEAQDQYNLFLLATKNLDMKPRMSFMKDMLMDMKIEIKEADSYDLNKFINTSYLP